MMQYRIFSPKLEKNVVSGSSRPVGVRAKALPRLTPRSPPSRVKTITLRARTEGRLPGCVYSAYGTAMR